LDAGLENVQHVAGVVTQKCPDPLPLKVTPPIFFLNVLHTLGVVFLQYFFDPLHQCFQDECEGWRTVIHDIQGIPSTIKKDVITTLDRWHVSMKRKGRVMTVLYM
jgi:hypothetical protein